MPVTQRLLPGNPVDRYSYRTVSQGFQGLLTAFDPSLSAGEYLADMQNLIVMSGTLRSVNVPTVVSTGVGPVNAVAKPFNKLMVVRGGVMSDGGGDLGAYQVPPIVYYAGHRYWVNMNAGGGLICDGTPVAAVWNGIDTDPGAADFNAVAVYVDRLYTSHGSYIRFNNPGNAALDSVWTGDYIDNIIRMHGGGAVHFLYPTFNGLLIILYGSAYLLTDPFSGSLQCVYSGGGLPVFVSKTVQPYCDGSNLYYCQSDGMYAFNVSSGVQKVSRALGFPFSIKAYYVGEYLNRIWFLVCSAAPSTSSSPNLVYAFEKTDGLWERYDFGHPSAGGNFLTALHGSGDFESDGIKGLYLGTDQGVVEKWTYQTTSDTCLPWSLKTRAYIPDENELIHYSDLELDYTGGVTDGELTIQTVLDGQVVETKAYVLKAGHYLHHDTYRVQCRHSDSSLPSTLQVVLSGTTPIEIGRIAVNFRPRSKGANFDAESV
jgi:hypothetical protein